MQGVESALPKIGETGRRERARIPRCPIFSSLFFFVRSFVRFSRVSDIAKERRGGGRNFPFVFVLLGFSFENVKKESERGLRGRKEIRVV